MAAAYRIDPMLVAAVMFSVDRCVARFGGPVEKPATQELAELWAYWQRATAITGEDLALQVAADLPIGAFGMASYRSVSAATLGQAIELLGRDTIGKLIPGMTLRTIPVSREHSEIRAAGEDGDMLSAMLEEIVLAIVFRHLPLMSSAATIHAVTLRRPGPTTTPSTPWRTFFGLLPRFAQRYTALRLAASDLSVELRTADPALQQLARAAEEGGPDEPIVARLKSLLRTRLGQPLDAETIADALGLTARTLQRRLQTEQTSLRDVAAAVRIEVARDMLEKTETTIAEIAIAVGFTQPASFSRAFAGATGESPQAYRKRFE